MTDELRKAQELEATLTRVKELWEELPSEDDLDELCQAVQKLNGALQGARQRGMGQASQ